MLKRRGLLLQVARAIKRETTREIHVPGWRAISSSQVSRIERLLDRRNLNYVLVDLKDTNGDIFFAADGPIASTLQAKTAEGRSRAFNFSALRTLQRRGFKVYGRHVVFRSKGLYHARPDLQLHHGCSEYWVDPRRSTTTWRCSDNKRRSGLKRLFSTKFDFRQ